METAKLQRKNNGGVVESIRKLGIFALGVVAITHCKAMIVPNISYEQNALSEQPFTDTP